MRPQVRELLSKVQDISDELCKDTFPCEHKNPGRISCIAVIGKKPTASFDEYDKLFNMCRPCKAYWLSMRLHQTVRDM